MRSHNVRRQTASALIDREDERVVEVDLGGVVPRSGSENLANAVSLDDAPGRLADGEFLEDLDPGRHYSLSPPVVVSDARAYIGPAGLRSDLEGLGMSLVDFYETSLYTAFDGDLELVWQGASGFASGFAVGSAVGSAPGGAEDAHKENFASHASFREWRRNVANLESYPEHNRRVVQISLPDELAAHREDTILLLRLGRLICELLGAYVAGESLSGVARSAATFTNVFTKDEAPPPVSAPLLAGRRTNNVYARDSVTKLLPG